MPSSNPANLSVDAPGFDLLRVPVIGRFLLWRHSRTFLQVPMFAVAIVMILHGLLGPALAPKNLATVLTWVHFRGALVLVLLCAGNFFCLACPFMLVRNAARRLFRPRFNWPRVLRNKWISVALFAAILFSYELFSLWSSPWWTASLAVAYFVAVLLIDGLFKHAAFCKFVCPIGQFNFIASTLSPLEVRVRDQSVCNRCATKDCIRGRRAVAGGRDLCRSGLALDRECARTRNPSAWLRAGPLSASQSGQHGLHVLPRLRARVSSRQRRSYQPAAGRGTDDRSHSFGYRVFLATARILLRSRSYSASVRFSTRSGWLVPVYVLEAWMAKLLSVNHRRRSWASSS